jgi:hypothetical protein
MGVTGAQAAGSWVRGPGTYSFTLCASAAVVSKEGRINPNLHFEDGGPDGNDGSGGASSLTQQGGGGDKRSSAGVKAPQSRAVAAAPRGGASQGRSIDNRRGAQGRATPAEIVTGGRGGGAGGAQTGCDITGLGRGRVTLTVEAWGGGGGGAAGLSGHSKPLQPEREPGGNGGGGGGGGGYGKAVVSATIPLSGATTYWIKVGAGGSGGVTGSLAAPRNGNPGGNSEIRANSASGQVLVQGAGGLGGHWGNMIAYGQGGASGGGAPNGWSGTSGTNGAVAPKCVNNVADGSMGGLGGAGGGPGRSGPGYFGDGGNGGAGGATYTLVCRAHAYNYGLSSGSAGRNGQVKITW